MFYILGCNEEEKEEEEAKWQIETTEKMNK
jgi:hypothetical protein